MAVSRIYTAGGVARRADKSETWSHLAFKSGRIPTEVMIDDKRAAVTKQTLDRLMPELKVKAKSGSR